MHPLWQQQKPQCANCRGKTENIDHQRESDPKTHLRNGIVLSSLPPDIESENEASSLTLTTLSDAWTILKAWFASILLLFSLRCNGEKRVIHSFAVHQKPEFGKGNHQAIYSLEDSKNRTATPTTRQTSKSTHQWAFLAPVWFWHQITNKTRDGV